MFVFLQPIVHNRRDDAFVEISIEYSSEVLISLIIYILMDSLRDMQINFTHCEKIFNRFVVKYLCFLIWVESFMESTGCDASIPFIIALFYQLVFSVVQYMIFTINAHKHPTFNAILVVATNLHNIS